ncbi:MAG: helix-turn-helix domain-containing protein [Candidatus Methanoculleus thermohydrogenotrophicum]
MFLRSPVDLRRKPAGCPRLQSWAECRPQIRLLDIRSYNKAMRKTHRYRLYPTKAQVTLLEKTLGGMPMSL